MSKNIEFYIEALGQKEKELQEAYQNNASKFRIGRIEDEINRLEDYIHYKIIAIKNNYNIQSLKN